MSMVQVSQNLLFDFVNSLKEVAPLRRPENDRELDLVRQWAKIADHISEISESLSTVPGFDADAAYWAELATSYHREVRDYKALHNDNV